MSIGKRHRFSAETPATDNIANIIDKASQRSQPVTTDIPIAKIVPDEKNNRTIQLDWDNPRQQPANLSAEDQQAWAQELESIEELAATIDNPNVGLLHAVTVLRVGSTFKLVTGHRRVLAHKLLGRLAIPATIRDGVLVRYAQFVENVQRKNIDLGEALIGMRGLLDEIGIAHGPGLGQGNIAKALQNDVHLSRATSYRWAALLTAPEVLREAVEGRLVGSWAHVEELLRLPEDELPERLAQLTEAGYADQGADAGGDIQEAADSSAPSSAGPAARPSTRRPKDYVVLGKVRNPMVIKTVIERVLGQAPEGVNWSDLNAVTRAFKKMIADLQEQADSKGAE